MPTSIENDWDRIVTWLRDHTPASAARLGPPATTDDIAFVEALLNRPLPADLTGWWRRSCGVTDFAGGRLIPSGYVPYSIDEAVDCREMMLEVASGDDAAIAALVAQPAGSPCTGWLPVWAPIAHDGGGCYLFADLRHGPAHGCVTAWDKYEGAILEPRWPSTTAMLAEIADALQHGTDIHGDQPEARDDGTLDWV